MGSVVFTVAVAIAGVAAGAGCADERIGRDATTSERAAAAGMVSQLGALQLLAHSPAHVPTLLRASSAASVIALFAPAGTPVLLPSRQVTESLGSCLTDSASTATYRDCDLGEHMVDGSAVRTRDGAQAALTNVLIVGPSLHGAVRVDARLATRHPSDDAISGGVEVDAHWTVGDDEQVLDAELTLSGLRVSPAGCGVGGSVTLSGTLHQGSELIGRTSSTLNFGPSCGDLHVSP